jgi:hypothetical protein
MPISRGEFESGKVLSDLEKRVIAFLDKNRDKAFTVDEIADGINIQTDFRDLWRAIASGLFILAFPSLLNNLVTSGKIRINIIKGTYYYMAK